MERTISVEERIKRAEDIYNRRASSQDNIRYTYNKSENNKKSVKFSKIKKMIIQIILCFLIYAVFYIISNSEYIFSEDFRNNIKTLLNTEMDFNKIYNDTINYFSQFLSTNIEENVDNSQENQEIKEDVEENKTQNENISENVSESQDTTSSETDNIGGAAEEPLSQNNEVQEDNNQSEKSQMEIDAEDIKNSISFEVPVEGYISSTFGLRNPTTSSVPKNHTGLDIAAKKGTIIKSATDGTVTLASSYGDYGNHYKIEIDDVVIIYAHCSKLYLKEGDKVTKGQSIGEVGSTGNSTGPHLHFEIRKDGRLVDPQLILDI